MNPPPPLRRGRKEQNNKGGGGAHFGVGLVGVKPELQPTEHYRRTSLGIALQTTLDQMIQSNKLTNQTASKIILHFDAHMAGKLATVTPRMRFRCGEVGHVKEVDKVYKFLLKQCEINIKGTGFSKDNAVISNVGEVRLEMWPSPKKKE